MTCFCPLRPLAAALVLLTVAANPVWAEAPAASAAPDCQALLQAHLQTDLQLSVQAFDQTEGQGFRALAAHVACSREAGDLIEAYLQATGAKQSSLRWHLAQMRAMQGDAQAAIRAARTVLTDRDDRQPGQLRWNDYVLATIAFLQRDRVALQAHRDHVAAGSSQHFGNALNLKLLDALLTHFDLSYAEATTRIE